MASPNNFLGFKQTLYGFGLIVIPVIPWRLGSVSPSGTDISKLWSRDEKNKNSSILAKISPRHILRPTPKGRKYSGFDTLPSEFMNLLGLNISGSFQSVGSIWTAWRSGTTWAWDGRWKPFNWISLQINEILFKICLGIKAYLQ